MLEAGEKDPSQLCTTKNSTPALARTKTSLIIA
jgi:hypothetical protein